MAGFLTPLELEYLDGHLWKVTAPFEYYIGGAVSSERIIIPVGFFTDFASIPRLLWNILPPTGTYGKAAVIHDFLYRSPGSRTRLECDDIFLEAMKVLNVEEWAQQVIYAGVRVGGWLAWNSYRSKRIT